MYEDDYLENGNEGHDSDDYVPYYADADYTTLSVAYEADWHKTPAGDDCPWCKSDMSDFEPEDDDDAVMTLCRGHAAEFMGLSLDGMDRMDSEMLADLD